MLDKQTAAGATKEKATRTDSSDKGDVTKTDQTTSEKRTQTEPTAKTDETRTDQTTETAKPKSVSEGEPAKETEVPEEVMEVLNSLAVDLMQQVADELGISTEELNRLLTDLGMEAMDMLQTQNYQTLVITAGGESDPMSLLTKEDLYKSFQELTNALAKKLEELSKVLDVTPDEMTKLIEQAKRQLAQVQGTVETPKLSSEEEPVQTVDDIALIQTKDDAVPDADALLSTQDQDVPELTTEESVSGDDMSLTGEQPTETVLTEESRAQGEQSGQSRENGNDSQSSQPNLMSGSTDMLRAQAAVTQFDAAAAAAPESVDTESIIRQIVDYMEVNTQGDDPSLEMQLTPENLGTLRIQLAAKDGVVSAQIVAQNETVKNALESQLIRLVESFDEQGIKVDAVEVSVGTNTSPDSFDQSTGSESESGTTDSRSGYGRRLRNLNLSALTEGQEMEEEDRLAAEMLRAGGNTVDYAI
jgi:flagellar hook-length control protein FliK